MYKSIILSSILGSALIILGAGCNSQDNTSPISLNQESISISSTPTSSEPTTTSITPSTSIAWKTYKNEKYNYEIGYPASATIRELPTGNNPNTLQAIQIYDSANLEKNKDSYTYIYVTASSKNEQEHWYDFLPENMSSTTKNFNGNNFTFYLGHTAGGNNGKGNVTFPEINGFLAKGKYDYLIVLDNMGKGTIDDLNNPQILKYLNSFKVK